MYDDFLAPALPSICDLIGLRLQISRQPEKANMKNQIRPVRSEEACKFSQDEYRQLKKPEICNFSDRLPTSDFKLSNFDSGSRICGSGGAENAFRKCPEPHPPKTKTNSRSEFQDPGRFKAARPPDISHTIPHGRHTHRIGKAAREKD